MSASTTAASARSEHPPKSHGPLGTLPIARLVVVVAIILDVAILTSGVVLSGRGLFDSGWAMVLWAACAAVVGLVAIQTPAGTQLGMDMPVLLAAGFVLGPIPAGLVAFAGYVDVREFRGEISLDRALFNRAQTSLSVMAATVVFSLVQPSELASPLGAVAALLAVCVDGLLNYSMVAAVIALHERVSPRIVWSSLSLGSVIEFAATYVCFGLLSLLLSQSYMSLGAWGLVLFALPIVIARQAFSQTQRLEGAQRRLVTQRLALQQAADRIADERREERLSIAAGLHDDVLPPLFKVHLLGQVLKQELATGQLLALEDDLPGLLRATNEANESLRALIRDLRASPLGISGLAHTLSLLIRQLESETSIAIHADLEDVKGAPVVELLAYQVAREGLRNALKHSLASRVHLSLQRDEDCIRLVIEDDGIGFHPALVDPSEHFGLALMRERVELGGGVLQVDGASGDGTRIVARLPAAVEGKP